MDNGTRWVGIDLHRRRSFLTAITEEGEVEFRRRIVHQLRRAAAVRAEQDPVRRRHCSGRDSTLSLAAAQSLV